MGRQIHRRLAVLAIIGVAAVSLTVAANESGVSPVANASAATPRPSATAARVKPCPFPHELRGAFEAASVDAAIPPAMLYAVAKVESNLHPDAESAAGARGLLQVMPATAKSLDLNIDEPRSNVLAGARYLRQLLDRFSSTDLALAAYNAGPTAVDEAGGAPSGAVQTYVVNVNQIWHSVAGCS
jgi:soluble lytic murein transglycosylase-like protein